MTAKVADEDTQNQQLQQQIAVLGHKINQLASTTPVMSKAGGEIWDLKGRLRSAEDRGKETLSAHTGTDVLRRRAVEMEGKDEELIKMADQCRVLDRRLAEERHRCRSLKLEMDKINCRINELDRIEAALGKSKQDCGALRASLEHEKDFSKMLSQELETLKGRVKELETAEGQMDSNESVIRHDLAKLRTLTVALVEDKKAIAERLRQAEEKLSNAEEKRNAQSSSATTREKQQALRSKVDLEERIKDIVKEKNDLQGRLKTEEEKNIHLQNKIIIMKKRLQIMEQKREKEEKGENDIQRSVPNNPNHYCQTENNRVKELSQEVDRLRRRLQDKEALERELLKVDEDFGSLERRFQDEQKRTWVLKEELEVAKKEISRYHQVEKQEVNQEHLLLCRLQREQVKTRLLGKEVETLKKKIQNLTGTEESICRVQMAHSTLQKNLSQQEIRNRELAHEIEELTAELDQHRKINDCMGMSTNGGYFSNPKTTREVQTDPLNSPPPDYSSQLPIAEDKDKSSNLTRKSSTPVNDMDPHQTVNREVMMLTHTPGQPLHIKVTPHHILNTATLEISSPTADTAASYTSTAVIPTSGAATKQRITIIQNTALSALETKSISSGSNRATSPVARLFSPTSTGSATPDHNSPIQILTVRTCSPEPTEAVYCKTPERLNAWQHQETSSTNTNSRLITTEDNKIHIHLGSSYAQSINGTMHGIPQSVGPCYVRQEQKTQVVANGCHIKGVGKITSSITITPANSPGPHPSNITVSGHCD